MGVEPVPVKEPKSKQSFIDLLRLHMGIAFDENMVYLEIAYRTDKMERVNSVSITSP